MVFSVKKSTRRLAAVVAWVALGSACAYAVEPNYNAGDSGVAMGVGGSMGVPVVPTGAPSQTGTVPIAPSSGGGPGAGMGGASAMSGGATNVALGGTPNANGTGGAPATPSSGGASPSGSGGAVAAGDAFKCDPATVKVNAFKVQAKSSTGPEPVNQMGVHINLQHTGASAEAVFLNEMSVRYFFTADGVSSLVAECDYAKIGCANIQTRFVQSALPGADTYLEVGFTGAAGKLAANAETGEIQIRFHNSSYQGMFTRGNDPSAQGLMTAYADQTAIPAYHACQLVWGAEPAAN